MNSQGPRRTIVHVDMDAFFVSVELQRRPELVGQPVIVGGAGRRGVVAAASYEARAYGIGSAMPSSRAKRLCPQAVFLAGDHAHYRKASRRIMAILADFTPLVEPLSLDEAFLDVTAARRLFGTGEQIATAIRQRIVAETGLRSSAGVASNKFLAKLASERAKPRAHRSGPKPGPGVVVIEPGTEVEFLDPLPVRALWGVGQATNAKLERLGVMNVAELRAVGEQALCAALGPATGRHLLALANGNDERPVEASQRAKSMSQENTYEWDRFDRDGLERDLMRMSDGVAGRLRAAGLVGRTVQIKVRYGDFKTVTRSVTIDAGTDSATDLYRAACDLLAALDITPGVRLLGVGASGLEEPGPEQLTLDQLDGSDREARRRADGAIDEIRGRFGTSAIGPASLIDPDAGKLAARTHNEDPWG